MSGADKQWLHFTEAGIPGGMAAAEKNELVAHLDEAAQEVAGRKVRAVKQTVVAHDADYGCVGGWLTVHAGIKIEILQVGQVGQTV